MKKIPMDRLTELFAAMTKSRPPKGGDYSALYLPLEDDGRTNFGRWTSEAAVRLDELNTVRSAKDFFFPHTENLVSFRREGQKISIIDNRDPVEPFIVFGLRGCDARSLNVLDRVFLSDPVDTFYQSRRENGTIVSIACEQPEETCFCRVFDIDAADPPGDVAAWIVGNILYWESRTPKGEALTAIVGDLLTPADDADTAAVRAQQEAIRTISAKLPLGSLNLESFRPTKGDGDPAEPLQKLFNLPLWGELSEACVGCGTCTYVCPTCQCYDIRDFDTGHGIRRFRCWDSCMYSDFTMMAHGNPRTSQLERFRQRFMHKLVYFPANCDGMVSCVGCGRCVGKCPISMNIAKVIKALEVSVNV
jgi:ferredoxin